MSSKKVNLIDFPVNWIPADWIKNYDISLLVIDDRCEALEGLSEMFKKDQRDFKKLLSTIKLQLESESLIRNERKLQKKADNNKVLEFKATAGHSRLFGFIDDDNKSLIICTNTYWKTTGKKKRQSVAFIRAEKLMDEYYSRKEG